MNRDVTVTPEGMEPFTVSEHEIRRGQRELRQRLIELRQASPRLMRVVEEFEMLPILDVEIMAMGRPLRMYVDPLGILPRCGHKSELPAWMKEAADEARDSGSDWLEV